YSANNPVTKITVSLNINKMAADENDKALNPDYGTWYRKTDNNTKFMFEVTGRFFREGASIAYAQSTVNVGDSVRDADDKRPYAKAKDRSNTCTNTDDRSAWSYWNNYTYYWYTTYYDSNNVLRYVWHSAEARSDAGHLYTRANVFVYREANYTTKGVHTSPTTKSDVLCTFGSYNEFAVSFTQSIWNMNIYGNDRDYRAGSGSDWLYQDPFDWSGKHAYTDNVILEDTLPEIRPDGKTEYYGFLTRKLYISPDIYQYIDFIELYKKNVTTTVTDVMGTDEDGNTVVVDHKYAYTDTPIADPVIVTRAELDATGAVSGETDYNPGVPGYDDVVPAHNDYHLVTLVYPGDTEAADGGYHISLGDDEYVTSYKIHLKDLPGDGDFARELEGRDDLVDSYDHSKYSNDIFLGGGVYRINENIVAKDYNNIVAYSFTESEEPDSLYPTKPYYSSNSDSVRAYNKNADDPTHPANVGKALLASYRVPFYAGYVINETSSADHVIYDYEKTGANQNLDPSNAAFEIKVWNRDDTNQYTGRSANINSAT
ncbi:MAG: hypothetical protein K2F65_06140, partial [Eubacterium sp.]|nr:hypothetical protein [Eubacterium sp.]